MREHEKRLQLYHGSDVVIDHPDLALNTGFADLGRGFYVTDDCGAARRRAATRARREGAESGVVSVFASDEASLPWVTMTDPMPAYGPDGPFGLRFDEDDRGLAAWIGYIQTCRKGETTIDGLGEPAVVRAWIATEEVELVCSGLASVDDLTPYLDSSELIVQYCFRDQAMTDMSLTFLGAEVVVR